MAAVTINRCVSTGVELMQLPDRQLSRFHFAFDSANHEQ